MITSNIAGIIKSLDAFDKKEVPYALSKTLNKVAEISQHAVKHRIDDIYDITAKWNKVNGRFGVKRKNSHKNNLVVTVFIPSNGGKEHWIQDHETGSNRIGNILIPTRAFKEAYPNIKTNRAIKKKAKMLLSNKSKHRIFEAPVKKGSSVRAIFQREKGKVARTRKLRSSKTGRLVKGRKILNREVIPLFIIKRSVKEKSTLQFIETVTKVFNKNISKVFSQEIIKATKFNMVTK